MMQKQLLKLSAVVVFGLLLVISQQSGLRKSLPNKDSIDMADYKNFTFDIEKYKDEILEAPEPKGLAAQPKPKETEQKQVDPMDLVKSEIAKLSAAHFVPRPRARPESVGPEVLRPQARPREEYVAPRNSALDEWLTALEKAEGLSDFDKEVLESVTAGLEMREAMGITDTRGVTSSQKYVKPTGLTNTQASMKTAVSTTEEDTYTPSTGGGLMSPVLDKKGETPVDTAVVNQEAFDIAKDKIGLTDKQWDTYRNEVAKIESRGSGGYAAKGGYNNHYDGRYQMGRVAKADAAQILGIDLGHSSAEREAFRDNPELQEKAFAAFTAKNHDYLSKKSEKYRNLSKEEQLSVLAYAHNQGWSGARDWLKSGEEGKDAFGTSGAKYYNAVLSALKKPEEEDEEE
jgi:hypothetical protein